MQHAADHVSQTRCLAAGPVCDQTRTAGNTVTGRCKKTGHIRAGIKGGDPNADPQRCTAAGFSAAQRQP